MKEGFKGDTSLNKKVGGGTATADEKKRSAVIYAEALRRAGASRGIA